LCEAGFAALTSIVGIAESWPPDEPSQEVAQHQMPGAPLDQLHVVPDSADSRTLRSRERA
jgi:hypothetical protein